jgi:hypothetical protein
MWNTPPPWGYPPNHMCSGYQNPMMMPPRPDEDMVSYLRRTRRELKEIEQELRSEKKEERIEQRGRRFSHIELFLILTLAAPIVGPLYMYAIILGANHISDMLKQVAH